MCIICTGEIYKQNLNTLTELSVSYCLNLTSEKLQEILIQCKNLKTLRCNDCTSLTSLDLRNNKNLTTLGCSYCKSLTSLDLLNNINLKELWSSSEEVTSFGCVNLEMLYCYSCTSLTSLDLRNNINLTRLWCNNCTSLTSLNLQNNINLITLECYNCRTLTSLNLLSNIENIHHSRCPWICQNKDFSSNLQRLIKIQRWYRKLLIIKYMKSKQFVEWIYAPNNIGGKCHKLKLLKEFS